MGFFSWLTCDTNKSIPSSYSNRKTFPVHMITEDGQVFTENNYSGYGDFGGKDFYELLAELNGLTNRNEGINLAFADNHSGDNNGKYKMPKLVENLSCLPSNKKNWKEFWDRLAYPESCPNQGYFYDDDDDDDDDDDYYYED